jgi:hypothetical protein
MELWILFFLLELKTWQQWTIRVVIQTLILLLFHLKNLANVVQKLVKVCFAMDTELVVRLVALAQKNTLDSFVA